MCSGCDSKPEPQAKPAPQVVEQPTPPAAPKAPEPPPKPASILDAGIVEQAATLAGVRKFKLELGTSGQPIHVSLYHQQAKGVPAPVLDLRETQYPKSSIVEYETEVTLADGQVFEVEVKTAEGEDCEYSAKQDGTLIYTECQVSPDTLPDRVQEVIKTLLPDGKIEEAEVIRRAGQPLRYEVEAVMAGRKHKLKLDKEGGDLTHLIVVPAEIAVPYRASTD